MKGIKNKAQIFWKHRFDHNWCLSFQRSYGHIRGHLWSDIVGSSTLFKKYEVVTCNTRTAMVLIDELFLLLLGV